MNRNRYIFILSFVVAILIIGIGLHSRRDSYEDIEYIATLNGIKLSLEEYLVYLRTQIINFENIAGTTDIWKTDLNGAPVQEVAKQNALDSVVSVKITNEQASEFGIYLTDEDNAQALINAEALYETFNSEEKGKIQFDTVLEVIKDGILRDKVFEEITGIYNSQEEKEDIFNHMFEIWLQDIEVDKNAEVWDSIIIGM